MKHAAALLVTGKQARIGELFQMVRHRWLAQVQDIREFADRSGPATLAGEVGQDLEAHRLGEHLEQQGVPCRVVVGKAPRRKGAAGGGGVGKHG